MGAGTSTDGCAVRTTAATRVDAYYIVGTGAEIWEEANGVDGLQRNQSGCIGRAPIPADRCITHTENHALVACATTFAAASLAP